jgi:hypothetical protein
MKIFRGMGFLLLLCAPLACGILRTSIPESPGNIFIRMEAGDLQSFPLQETFRSQKENLKKHGGLAYSLHRDWTEKGAFILTLKCSNLRKVVNFTRSPNFLTPFERAGAKEFADWIGDNVVERAYGNRRFPAGGKRGIIVAHNEVKSYDFWKACWDAEGKHRHAKRGYQASRYSIHHLGGKPDQVLVVHEASDVSKAPAFMTSDHLKGAMEAMGVTGIDIWYGINLEEGLL